MHFPRLKSAAAILSALLLISCTSVRPHEGNTGSSYGDAPTPLSSASSYAPAASVTAEAQRLGVSPGRVALGEIVCQLDSSNVLEDLVSKHDSQELLVILRETALQKSTTLEALDEKYGLTSILASEGIHVQITSNGVVQQPPASSSQAADAWIPRFESAISSGR